jgi:tRNA pseudouridine38-40 synthase
MRAFRVAYDGRSYRGFQRQPAVETVEDRLFDALRELDVAGAADAPSRYSAAGRTDAGVTAVAQTITFECPDWCSPRAMNGPLPDSIRVWASADVPATFHATHDAVRRTYTYFLPAPEAAIDRVRAAADRLAGNHDFHNLTPETEGTVRDLAITVERDGPFLVVTVESDGFPRQLVRRLVALLDAIAGNERPMAAIDRVLDPEPIEGEVGVQPAPPEGLVLTAVDYPSIGFETDDRAIQEVRTGFEARWWSVRRESRALSRVLDELSRD